MALSLIHIFFFQHLGDVLDGGGELGDHDVVQGVGALLGLLNGHSQAIDTALHLSPVSYTHLIALAKCFRVSVDFILGIDGANVRLDRLTEDEAKAITMLVQAMEKANGSASEP